MRRRWIAILISAAVLATAAAAGWLWWRSTPPRAARLLPDADGYFYIDLATLRHAGAIDQLPPVSEAPEYRDFIQATGFRFERDVDAAAFAVQGKFDFDSAALEKLRFSEIFTGNIDRQRATAYLRRIAQSTATYHGREIFYIPREDRTVRISFLDDHNVAISNTESDAALHAMMDKFARVGAISSPLLHEFYGEVPAGSLVWLISKVNGEGQRPGSLLGLELRRLLGGTTVVASARFVTELGIRMEAIASTEEKAAEIVQNAGAFLQLYSTAEQTSGAGGSDPDIKAALRSVQVEQEGKRAILTASIPARALKKLAQ